MKAIVNPQALLKELKKMGLVVKKNHIIPITSSVLFSFEENKLTVTGIDLETTCISSLECACRDVFSFAIDYFDICDVFGSILDSTTIERKGKEIIIKSGKAKFNLPITGEVEHFPTTPEDDFVFDMEVDGDFFYHLSHANTCRSKDETRVSFNMAAIRVFKDHYDVVGIDGWQMYKKRFDQKSAKEFCVMVPNSFVSQCKLFQETKLSFGSRYIKAEFRDDVIISRLSENTYVNLNSILPAEVDYNITFDKSDLRNNLNIVSVAAMKSSKQFSVKFKDGEVKLMSKDIDFGKEAEAIIYVQHSVGIPEICLNSSSLLHLTSLIDTDEVDMAFTTEDKTVYMKPSGDDSVLISIQPLVIINQN